MVRRHEVMRTTFQVVKGRPVQVVGPAVPVPLPVIDLSALSAEERKAELHRLSLEEPRRPYDLTQGPLLRLTLLRLGEGGAHPRHGAAPCDLGRLVDDDR